MPDPKKDQQLEKLTKLVVSFGEELVRVGQASKESGAVMGTTFKGVSDHLQQAGKDAETAKRLFGGIFTVDHKAEEKNRQSAYQAANARLQLLRATLKEKEALHQSVQNHPDPHQTLSAQNQVDEAQQAIKAHGQFVQGIAQNTGRVIRLEIEALSGISLFLFTSGLGATNTLSKALQQTNTDFSSRNKLLNIGLDAMISTGQSAEVVGQSMAALANYGLESADNFADLLDTSVKLHAALGVSVGNTSELARVSNQTGSNFKVLGDNIAKIAATTSLTADEAARFTAEIGKGIAIFGDSSKGQLSGIQRELLSFSGALKSLGADAASIPKFVGQIQSGQNITGAALLGIQDLNVDTEDSAKQLTKSLAGLSKQFQGSSIGARLASGAMAEALGIDQATFRLAAKAYAVREENNKRYGGILDSTDRLQKAYNDQLAQTGETLNLLKGAFIGLAGKALMPVISVLNQLASAAIGFLSILEKMHGFTTALQVFGGIVGVGLITSLVFAVRGIVNFIRRIDQMTVSLTAAANRINRAQNKIDAPPVKGSGFKNSAKGAVAGAAIGLAVGVMKGDWIDGLVAAAIPAVIGIVVDLGAALVAAVGGVPILIGAAIAAAVVLLYAGVRKIFGSSEQTFQKSMEELAFGFGYIIGLSILPIIVGFQMVSKFLKTLTNDFTDFSLSGMWDRLLPALQDSFAVLIRDLSPQFDLLVGSLKKTSDAFESVVKWVEDKIGTAKTVGKVIRYANPVTGAYNVASDLYNYATTPEVKPKASDENVQGVASMKKTDTSKTDMLLEQILKQGQPAPDKTADANEQAMQKHEEHLFLLNPRTPRAIPLYMLPPVK